MEEEIKERERVNREILLRAEIEKETLKHVHSLLDI
jgi:hypothetical protein